MKILTMVWSIGVGGTERAAVNYAIAYRQHGHDSKVLVLGDGNVRQHELQAEEVEAYFLQNGSSTAEEIFSVLKKWQPEIIHLHNFSDAHLPYIEKVKSPGTKVVETNVFSRPNYNTGYKGVSLSMQLSHWGYWKYTGWMKGAGYIPGTVIVPYIVFEKKFTQPTKEQVIAFLQQHDIPQGAFVAGRLGQAHPSKWDSRIFDVVEQTVKPDNNIYYLFVGLPAKLAKELDLKSELVKSRIKLIDSITGDENLSLYYHSLNCFTHISKIGESFGYVLAEALMCEVPVVTMLTPFHDNAQYEVVGHNYGGICVTGTSAFSKAVLQLYNSPEEYKRFKNNLGNHWIEKRFGSATVIPALMTYYSRLLKGEKIEQVDSSVVIRNCFQLYGWSGKLQYYVLRICNSRRGYLFLQKIKQLLR